MRAGAFFDCNGTNLAGWNSCSGEGKIVVVHQRSMAACERWPGRPSRLTRTFT
jgi:hypothetical protein